MCRHTKRYQDIQELLNAGIDVYTTVNVQHIESLNDTVASITGIMVHERIPDSVFDNANQVELVDIEPQELIDRLHAGNVYNSVQAERATENFFTAENLTALREIALRRCADRVNLLTETVRIKSHSDYHTDEHILVCLSSSPSNACLLYTSGEKSCYAFGVYFGNSDKRIMACFVVRNKGRFQRIYAGDCSNFVVYLYLCKFCRGHCRRQRKSTGRFFKSI